MRTVMLPFDPEGGLEFDDEFGTWLPALCPLCGQGQLNEETFPDGEMYTCFSPRHPMYACHTQFWVPKGLDRGTFDQGIAYLKALGVLQ